MTRFLLFFRKAWCEDRPGLMFAGLFVCGLLVLITEFPN